MSSAASKRPRRAHTLTAAQIYDRISQWHSDDDDEDSVSESDSADSSSSGEDEPTAASSRDNVDEETVDVLFMMALVIDRLFAHLTPTSVGVM